LPHAALQEAKEIAMRLRAYSSKASRGGVHGRPGLAGPKILVQGNTARRAAQVAVVLACEVSRVACVLDIRELASSGMHPREYGSSLAWRAESLVTANASSGKMIVIEDSAPLFCEAGQARNPLEMAELLEMLLRHQAAIIFAMDLKQRIGRDDRQKFVEILRLSDGDAESSLRSWHKTLDGAGIRIGEAELESISREFVMELEDIRSIVLSLGWECAWEFPDGAMLIGRIKRLAKQLKLSRERAKGFPD
jgi:hypothetical protein